MYRILENQRIAKDVYRLILEGNTSKINGPGQFINIKIDGFYLRRPISICDYDQTTITVIYKVFGEGTKTLTKYNVGDKLDCLVGLGNGFTVNKENHSLIIAGGVGTPPMYNLAKELLAKGNEVTCVLGYTSADDVFLEQEFKELGCNTIVTTLDGTHGFKGNVIEYVTTNNVTYDSYYSCGPKGLLKALQKMSQNGQLSLEERMGCGFGACMGCSCKTTYGYARICKEGPVLNASEVLFDE